MFIVISLYADCQDYLNIHALIAGHQSSDTIRMDDIFRFSEILLDNKEYSIVSFTMHFSDSGYDYDNSSYSNRITDDMKKDLLSIKEPDTKFKIIVFKDIFIQKAKGRILKIGDSVYKLRLE